MLGLGWFRRKEQISAFSEFCNVGARPVYALSFSKGLLQMGVVLRIFADLRHGFYTIVSNEGFLFKIGLLRHAQPRKPKNEALHYSLLQMRKSAIHAEACYYSIATNETCHYSNTPIEACHCSNIPIEACHLFK